MKTELEQFIFEVGAQNIFSAKMKISTAAAIAAVEFIKGIQEKRVAGGKNGKKPPVTAEHKKKVKRAINKRYRLRIKKEKKQIERAEERENSRW